MPLLTALALALGLVSVTALPAAAGPSIGATMNDPSTGFPIALVVLAVVATVFALVWRARGQRKDR